MKFKSTIVDIPILAKITQSLALLSKQAWIKLSPDSVQFIIQPSGTQVWATIERETIFTQYVIESNAENTINLEVSVDALGRLLRSIADTGQVLMKLTKRDKYPMLSFNTQFFGKQGGSNTVTHDLHVRVLSSTFISQIREPSIPEPDVVILLPSLLHLAQISGSLKVLSDKLLVSANGNGEFSIGVSTSAVSASTAFTGLVNPSLDPASTSHDDTQHEGRAPREKGDWVKMKVDAKDWCNLLRIGSIAKSVIACFCEDHAIVLYVYVSEEGDDHSCVLTYYIATYQD